MPIEVPARPREPFRLTGRLVLLAMVGFFAVVAGVNAVMMTIAISTMPGVDVKSAYESSQRYNGEIARMRAQQARGWTVDASLRRAGEAAAVSVDFADKAGKPVTGLAVTVRLEHPARRVEDHEAKLSEVAPGRYAAQVPATHAGGWTLALTATRDDATLFETRSRVMLGE
ncbi:FixH family protein [Bosea sp. TWI1241]|uniref:FixH family protein n=1 Tax=Bosea sp. TWI1241 TaxID=3148904 RepID=UPI003208C82A